MSPPSWGLSPGHGLLWLRAVAGEPADQQEVQVHQIDRPGHQLGADPRHRRYAAGYPLQEEGDHVSAEPRARAVQKPQSCPSRYQGCAWTNPVPAALRPRRGGWRGFPCRWRRGWEIFRGRGSWRGAERVRSPCSLSLTRSRKVCVAPEAPWIQLLIHKLTQRNGSRKEAAARSRRDAERRPLAP